MTLSTNGHVDPLGVAAIQRLITNNTIASASYHAQLESTNSQALQALRERSATEPCGYPLPRLYLADQQTAGRGRHGRTWISDSDALTFSLLAKSPECDPQDTALISIAIGIAIARSIEFLYAPLRSRLKWPNDVYVDGGKVAGILLESTHLSPDQLVIGVGINVNAAPTLPLTKNAATPKSIAGAVGRSVSQFDLLETTLEQVFDAFAELADSKASLVGEFRNRCFLTGSQVSFQDVGDSKSSIVRMGLCKGISDHGELIIETDSGIRHCRTGEVNQVRALK